MSDYNDIRYIFKTIRLLRSFISITTLSFLRFITYYFQIIKIKYLNNVNLIIYFNLFYFYKS